MKLTSNQGVIDAFIAKGETSVDSHNHNLRYTPWYGKALINYKTIIAKWEGETVLLDQHKYSQTTSKIQTQLRNSLAKAGIHTEPLDH